MANAPSGYVSVGYKKSQPESKSSPTSVVGVHSFVQLNGINPKGIEGAWAWGKSTEIPAGNTEAEKEQVKKTFELGERALDI